jgi:hypothetical protein
VGGGHQSFVSEACSLSDGDHVRYWADTSKPMLCRAWR